MRPPRRRRLLGGLAGTIAFMLLGAWSPVAATHPGSNGDIIFVRDGEFRAMSPDGSGDHLFTSLKGNIGGVSFSSGGTTPIVVLVSCFLTL
jgi:hypothetical protein